MNDNACLMLRYCPPFYGKPVEVWLDLPRELSAPFAPLPRDRELYVGSIISLAYSPKDRVRVVKQITDRAKLAEYLAPLLADALAKAITKQDTINGYDQEEGT